MKAKKVILITLGVIVGLICLSYTGLQFLGKKIYNSRGCDWGNIDNVELHTRTDIPAIKNAECSYDTILKAKKVVFELDKNNVDIVSYIAKNNFKKAASKESLPVKDISGFEKNPAAFDTISALYYKKGSNYSMILDSQAKKLWVYLTYED